MKPILVMFALLIWAEGVQAEQIHLLFSEGCGNRIRYERTVDGESRMDYFSYSLTAVNSTQLIFETDAEGAAYQRSLPVNYLTCSDATLTADLADRINSGQSHLFIILPASDGRYLIQPVVMAAVMELHGDDVRYRSPFTAFSFSQQEAIIGVDLDNGNEGAQVYFEGREGNECDGPFLFRHHNPRSAHPTIEYKLLPKLGIVQRRMGGDGQFSKALEISAREVNGLPLSDFLRKWCTTEPMTELDHTEERRSFTPLYVEAVLPPPSITAEAQSKDVPSDTAPAAPPVAVLPATIHRVAPGETLYAISRRYGVAVNSIKERNGLSTNTIYVGQQLSIGEESGTSEPPESHISYQEPVVVPTPHERPVIEEVSVTSDKYHIVQPGETFASLALRFGYTTARFREFNGLTDQAVVQIGQRLKTSECTCPPAAPTYEPAPEVVVPRPSSYVAPAPIPESNLEYTASPQTYSDSYSQPVSVTPPSVNVVVPQARPMLDGDQSNPPPAYGGGINISPGVSADTYGGNTTPAPADLRSTHQVREGESLYSISRQYNVTVEELRRLNDLLPADVIVPFQKLYVN